MNKDEALLRIRRASDFPALASTVQMVSKFKTSEEASVSELANIILKDYALTTKILKVVNSVHYQRSGQVTTISRAIFLIGLESIKNIALTLMLLDHLHKSGANRELMDAIVQSFCGGIIAQKVVHDLNFIEEEEAFICALLHPLGKILVAFSMPDRVGEIRRLSIEKGISEELASLKVLGISYEDIGTTLATEWNFPQKIINSMTHVHGPDTTKNPDEPERLGSIATFSTEMANVISADSAIEEKRERMQRLVTSYKEHFGAVAKNIDSLVSASAQELGSLAEVMNVNLKDTLFSRQLAEWMDKGEASVSDTEVLSFRTESLKTLDSVIAAEDEDLPENVFSKGIRDINNSMLGAQALNDVIRIVLETIYRGMRGANILRALFFVRDTRKPMMSIRLGFGGGIEEAKEWFLIQLGETGNVFSVAISDDRDLLINDIDAPDVRRFVPEWYRRKMPVPSYLILLPITVNKKNIGLFCLEGERKGYENISHGHLNYLRILRDQTILAIRQQAPSR